MADAVVLTLPAKPQYMVMARLIGAAVAGQAGFDVERIEDFKTAVAEACLLLLPGAGEDGRLTLRLSAEAGAEARISAPALQETPDTPERAFSAFLLGALVDEAQFSEEDGEAVYVLRAAHA